MARNLYAEIMVATCAALSAALRGDEVEARRQRQIAVAADREFTRLFLADVARFGRAVSRATSQTNESGS
jgi:hypothetical protein